MLFYCHLVSLVSAVGVASIGATPIALDATAVPSVWDTEDAITVGTTTRSTGDLDTRRRRKFRQR